MKEKKRKRKEKEIIRMKRKKTESLSPRLRLKANPEEPTEIRRLAFEIPSVDQICLRNSFN